MPSVVLYYIEQNLLLMGAAIFCNLKETIMSVTSQFGRLGAIMVLGIAAAELLIMISPFAGLFFTSPEV